MKEIMTAKLQKIVSVLTNFFDRVKKNVMDEDDGEIMAKWIKKSILYASPIMFSFIISQKEMMMSTYPLGLILMSAARADTLLFFLGTMIFAIFSKRASLVIGALSLIILRIIFSRAFESDNIFSHKGKLREKIRKLSSVFCESETLKLSASAVSVFAMGIFNIIYGGFSIGDLIGTCICVILAPCLCYLFSGYFTAVEKSGYRYESGLIALLATFIFAISDIKPFGISLAVICASFISFSLAKRKNSYSSCLFALVSVLAAEPLVSPSFAISAAIAAFLYKHSKLYAICLGSISFALISYIVGGLDLFASFFPEFILGAIISIPVEESTVNKFLPFARRDILKRNDEESEILSYKEQKARENIKDISESFDELSKAFFELSDKNTRLGIFDTRHICDTVCDRYCRKCSSVELCWEYDYALTLDILNRISAKIYKTGKVDINDLPKEFIRKCPSHQKLIEDIEKENRRVIKSMIKEDKTRAFAVDYAVFSRVLSEALQKNEAEYAPNLKARDELKEAFSKIGFYADSIGVYGSRCKNVYAFRIGKEAIKCKAEDIKAVLCEAFESNMEDPVFEFVEGGINMICKQAPSFNACCSSFSFAAEKCKENGDRVTAFNGKNGYFYALVNDGMGSGRAAAKKSAAASLFLEKMLRAGNTAASGIEMLSALARADGEEGFTTLDLFEFDMISGKASFIKSGAAPSFVKRGSKLFKIRSKTFPIGILEDVDAERTTFDCEDGDKIIILSDGVTEDIEEPVWLCELFSKIDLSSEDAAEKIISEAKAHTLCKDDMTAAVISINKI